MNRYLTNEKGSMLPLALVFLVVFTLMGYGLINLGAVDAIEVLQVDRSAQAFWLAEAGLARAMYHLRMDFVNGGLDWSDGSINGISYTPNFTDFTDFDFSGETASGSSLGNGSYQVQLQNIAAREIWIRSTGIIAAGSAKEVRRIIQVRVGVENRNIWNNAIFAEDASQSSQNLINGNVTIAGSVHILGTNYLPTDVALDMTGGARILNNYEPVDTELLNVIPDCPQVWYNGETVDSLSAQVKVQHGNIFIDSSASGIGEPDVPGNQYKETVDAVYQNDGYTGSQGENEVFSDNGPYSPYIGDEHYVRFPSLQDPYYFGGTTYATYLDFLQANSLMITDAAQLAELADIKYDSNFDYSDANGRIAMDGDGHLTIDGIVYIGDGTENDGYGADMTISRAIETIVIGTDPETGLPITQDITRDITYTGNAAILTTGSVKIDCDFYSEGAESYPDNIIGIMTPHNVHFGDSSQIDVAGVFYAEEKISAVKQTEVAGAWVSNCFDMGKNVPAIYQVWAIIDHLPFGLIGSNPHWVCAPTSWEEIPS